MALALSHAWAASQWVCICIIALPLKYVNTTYIAMSKMTLACLSAGSAAIKKQRDLRLGGLVGLVSSDHI
jgi:hypothetical protein